MEAKTRRIRQAEEPEPESGLRAQYGSSWAVVIGINAYQHLNPLTYAVNDAVAMRDLLVDTFGFPTQNVFLLKDKEATKEAIEAIFIDTLPGQTGPDDRVFVFFAGHGARRLVASGEKVGYLAPVDARSNVWRTHFEMRDLLDFGARSAAKHVFYVLDCCYGGLASTRSDTSATRFQYDMLTNKGVV